MEKLKIGFIGAGNMGGALARAVARQLPQAELLISNRTPQKAQALAGELGGEAVANEEVAGRCSFLFLGVKPDIVPRVLEELAPVFVGRAPKPVLVSMAARVSLAQLAEWYGGPVIRIMPNTPVSIGQGVTLYTCGSTVGKEEQETFLAVMAGSGSLIEIEEKHMAAGGVVAGCGPAFVDLFLEAVADGGVLCGLPRPLALRLAAEMAAGAARLALATGEHPGVLKDAVCSPGGSTIQGVRELEKGGLRSAVMEAVIAACGKS